MLSPAMDAEYDDRVCIDLRWTDGSIRMAASPKALHDCVEPRLLYADRKVAVIRDVEWILQSSMLPTRTWLHFSCRLRLVSEILLPAACALHSQQTIF